MQFDTHMRVTDRKHAGEVGEQAWVPITIYIRDSKGTHLDTRH